MKHFNINKELEFINSIQFLKQKYGNEKVMKWYWKPQFYKNGLPIIKNNTLNDFNKDVNAIHKKLENPEIHTKENIKEYNQKIDYIIKKLNFKLDKNIDNKKLQLQRASIYRYYIIDALNNISLSVSPIIKKEWKINFELFGAFYNTNVNYCGLFSDIEDSCCDFYTFNLKENMTILINPPYTEEWIKISCKIINNIMKKDKNTKIYLVIPVWNCSDRKILGLKECKDLPEIDKLKNNSYLQSHNIKNLEFYDGITKRNVYLKDKVHIFIFKN